MKRLPAAFRVVRRRLRRCPSTKLKAVLEPDGPALVQADPSMLDRITSRRAVATTEYNRSQSEFSDVDPSGLDHGSSSTTNTACKADMFDC